LRLLICVVFHPGQGLKQTKAEAEFIHLTETGRRF